MVSMLFFSEESLILSDFFKADELPKVKNGDIIARMYLKHNSVKENTHLSITEPKSKYIDVDLIPYEMICDEKTFFPYNLTQESKLKLYNTFVSYSKLKGMQYYSLRKVHQLIMESYRIKSPKDKHKINDPVYDKIYPKITNYFLQEDNKFGKLIFKSDIYNEGNNFVIVNTCMQPIKKFISINKKEEYKFYTFFIYDKESNGYFYYSISAMRIRLEILITTGIFGIKLRPTTFSNRLRATTIHLLKLLGIDRMDKINPWNEEKLANGYYRTY